MIYVDSDNAMGSEKGNVDDGFAIAALLCSGAPVLAVGSVAGNATEEQANANHRALAAQCGFRGVHLRSYQAADFLTRVGAPLTIAALGPLTNIAAAMEKSPDCSWCAELVVVGGNPVSPGRWPPLWPYEFNLTADRWAARRAFDSPARWTVVPLNLLDRLWASRERLSELQGAVGAYLRNKSERWMAVKPRFRIGDLIAAMYLIDPSLLRLRRTRARMHGNGWIQFGRGEKEVELVYDFDGDALWRRFVAVINATR
jgi:inosine-uridine nucleoside N-ribohydrolase